MNTLKRGLMVTLLGVLMMSCLNEDEGYSMGDYWLTTGTITKTLDYYFVTTDGGEVLWPTATNVNPEYLNDSMRVIVNYTILDEAADNEDYDYYVKVNSLNEILTKPIFNFTAETSEAVRDSIGNDPVTITDTWFTGKYLNIEFEYGGGPGYIHFINLVKDTKDPETENGEIILELKHNKDGDPFNYLNWGIASFDLSELQTEGESSVDIFVRALGKSGEYEYNKVLTYEYLAPVAQAMSIRSENIVSTIE